MTKQWKVKAQKADVNYVLYVATSDETIQLDKDAGRGSSLIESARQERYLPENIKDDEHRDLAIGAFRHYARLNEMKLGSFMETDSIPEGLKKDWLGGKPGSHTFAVIVYEQRI